MMKGLLLLLCLYCLVVTLYNFFILRRLEVSKKIIEEARQRKRDASAKDEPPRRKR